MKRQAHEHPPTNIRPLGARHFTLIELLVVIAIIAILASLLLPTLKSAMNAASHSQCLSTIRQQSLAIIMYAGDSDNTWPVTTTFSDFRGLGEVLSQTEFPKNGKPIFGYPTSLFTNYLCPATTKRWGFQMVSGMAADTDNSDANNHLAYPGCYSASFANAAASTDAYSWISGKRVDNAGKNGLATTLRNGVTVDDPYQRTPPYKILMISDSGFTYQAGSQLSADSDHGDGKWNAVFIDGHAKHYPTPNGRGWQYLCTLSDTLPP